MSDKERFEQWAIVDVMGHQRYVGLVTEEVVAGTGFVRVDVPAVEGEPAWSKLIGTSSIYAITPISEEIARAMAERSKTRPVEAYELPTVREQVVGLTTSDRYREETDDEGEDCIDDGMPL